MQLEIVILRLETLLQADSGAPLRVPLILFIQQLIIMKFLLCTFLCPGLSDRPDSPRGAEGLSDLYSLATRRLFDIDIMYSYKTKIGREINSCIY